MSIDQFLSFHSAVWQDHVDDNKSVFLQQDAAPRCAWHSRWDVVLRIGCSDSASGSTSTNGIMLQSSDSREKVAMTSEQRSSILPGTLPVTQLRGHKSSDAQSKGSQDTQMAIIY